MRRDRSLAVKVFCGFLVVMAVCTMLSRAAASVLVAQVEVKKPGRGKLSYIYEGTGNIVPKKEENIFLWEGQQVEWTARQGSKVEKGKCLVRFRKEYLDKEIEKKQSELMQLVYQVKEQQIASKTPARVSAAESAYLLLQDLKKKLEKARNREKKARSIWKSYEEEWEKEEEADSLKKQTLKEEYLAAKAETEALEQEKSQAQAAYNLAKKEDAAQEKNNANAKDAAQMNIQAQKEQVNMVQKELKALREYKKAGGKILAEKDCMVLENSIQTGTVTTGTEYISLGMGGWKLKGEIAAEDRDKIIAGNEAEVQFDTGGKVSIKIENVEYLEREVEGALDERVSYFWYASLPSGINAEETGAFTWKSEKDSVNEYEQTMPLSALREDISGAYCLVISEKEQMLGTVMVAKRVPVTVVEKDGMNAAVTSELKKTDRIIVSSEKFISGGDRVRLKE